MHTLFLGTVLLDQLAAAVHAVQDRLQREHDQEETHEHQAHDLLPAGEVRGDLEPADSDEVLGPDDSPHPPAVVIDHYAHAADVMKQRQMKLTLPTAMESLALMIRHILLQW